MTSSYSVFGISMQRRSARRKFVFSAYLVLAAICGITVAFIHSAPYLYTYAVYGTMAFMLLIFGWQGRGGLIKPFPNKPPLPDAPMVSMVRLQLDPLSAATPEDSAWRNDERELARRDLAHYRAYQPLSLALLTVMTLSAIASHPWPWVSPPLLSQIIFAVALAATMMAITLPAAIILWTEPDIDLN